MQASCNATQACNDNTMEQACNNMLYIKHATTCYLINMLNIMNMQQHPNNNVMQQYANNNAMAMDHVMQHLVDLNRIWTDLRGSKTVAKRMKQWHEK